MRATDRVGIVVTDPTPAVSSGDLTTRGLLGLSVLWIALAALPSTLSLALQARVEHGELISPADLPAASLAFALGAFVAICAIQAPVGWLSDRSSSRWGRRLPFVAGGILCTVPAIGAAIVSHDLAVVVGSIALADIGLSIAQGAYQTYLVDLVPRRQVPRAAAFMFMGLLAGNVIGLFLGLSYLDGASGDASLDGSPRVIGGLLAVVVITLTVATRATLPIVGGVRGSADRTNRDPPALSGRRGRAYLTYLAVLLCFLSAVSITMNLATLYVQSALAQGAQASVYLQMRSVLIITGSSLAGAIVALPAALATLRAGWRPVALGGCALGACGTAILAISSSLPTAFVGFLLVGAALGVFTPAGWWLLVHLVDATRPGAALGIASIPMAVAPLGMALVLSSQAALTSGSAGATVRGAMLAIIALFIVAAGLVSRIPDPEPAFA